MSNRYYFCNCGKKIVLGEQCDKCNSDKKQNKNTYMCDYNKRNKDVQKPLNSKRWKNLRSLIIQRDNSICQRCLAKKQVFNSTDLQVHHIKPRINYPELMFDEDNLITLCKTCNLEIGTRETLDFKKSKDDFEFHL